MQRRRIRTTCLLGMVVVGVACAHPQMLGYEETTPHQSLSTPNTPIESPESSPLGAALPSPAAGLTERATIGGVNDTSPVGFSRTLGALVGVVGLILLLSMILKQVSRRKGGLMSSLGAAGRAPSGVIEVLARYPVARTQRLVLLRVGRRIVLCNQTAGARASLGGMTTLTEITDAEEVASILRSIRDTDGSSHASLFREALKGAEIDPATTGQSPESTLRYESPEGDTVTWRDERVQMPTRSPARSPAASSEIDPSIGRLRARLASMRTEGDAA